MDKQNKAYAILFFIIWPFSTLFLVIRYFDYAFGRKLLILLYGFLGFTAISFGDLDRYEKHYYVEQTNTFTEAINSLLNLQEGKFYNSLISIVTGVFFDSHHYYFLILFMVYGYFLTKSVYLMKVVDLNKLNKFGMLFFLGLLLYFLIRPLPNLAFYTGGLFLIFNLINYYTYQSKKYLFYIFFTPLFHIGLSIYLLLPLIFILFRNKVWYYVVFVVFTFFLGQSDVVKVIGNIAESNSGTVLESKYNSYASEEGQESIAKRYEENGAKYNGKLRILLNIQKAIWYLFVPIGLILLFLYKKQLLVANNLLPFFNMVLSCWGISNLMLNISQGERFVLLFSFIAIGLFYNVYIKMKGQLNQNYFGLFLKFFVPIFFLYCVLALIASHFIVPINFFVSNFFIEIFTT